MGEVAIEAPDPVMMLGYWNNEEATKAKFRGDWFTTGDLASVDESGCFTFVGRDDDIIISSGYRIGPAEIEDTLVKHSGVIMAAVIGKPDRIRGEVVKAFVILRDDSRESQELRGDLQNLVRSRLAAHEYPREIEFVRELPMTVTGKIQRNVLRQREKERSEGTASGT